ncbi:NADH-cytochrome b5 reductase [Dinochytrium kinnereticum]|nr:NADH-cytochrome b5 reductase [Dinochytrium kinnereticum]
MDIVPLNEDRATPSKGASTTSSVAAPTHVIVMDESCQIARPYTPITYGPSHFDLLIKSYKDGSISQLMHRQKVGDWIPIRGPIQTFDYKAGSDTVVMIAGGTGITPMYQLLKRIMNDPSDVSRVLLIYGSKTEEDVLLKRELDVLQSLHADRLKVHHIIEKMSGEMPTWSSGSGHINRSILERLLPSSDACEKVQILLCGPDSMIRALAGPKPSEFEQGPLGGVLRDMGFSPNAIQKL